MTDSLNRIYSKYRKSFEALAKGVDWEHCAFDIIDEYTPKKIRCGCSKCIKNPDRSIFL